MNANSNGRQIFIWVVLVMGILGLAPYLAYKFYTLTIRNKAINQMNSPQATEAFRQVIGCIDDMNSGITINLRPSIYQIPREDRLDYDIWAINNTVEPIIFQNNGFGVQVFAYDSTNNPWQQIELGWHPSTYSITIAPDSNVIEDYNYWLLNSHLFMSVGRNEPIRVFISGRGESSGKQYGAYQDVWLYR